MLTMAKSIEILSKPVIFVVVVKIITTNSKTQKPKT